MPFNFPNSVKLHLLKEIIKLLSIFIKLLSLLINSAFESTSPQPVITETLDTKEEFEEERPTSYCLECARKKNKKYRHPFEEARRRKANNSFGEDTEPASEESTPDSP